MKVPETQHIRAVGHSDTAAGPRQAPADRTIHDRVTVTPPPRPSPEAVAAGQRIATTDRAARLERLSAAVRGGHHVPDPRQIASRLLDHVDLEAQLQAVAGQA